MLGTQTNRPGPGMLTAIVLAAVAIVCTAAPNARGDSGWSTWQNLDRPLSNPLPNEEAFRLSTAVFINSTPMIVTVDRKGKFLSVREGRTGFWANWYFLDHPGLIFPYITMTSNATPQPIIFYRGNDGVVSFAEVIQAGSGLLGGSRWTSHESLGRPSDAFPNLIYAMRLGDRRVAVCFTDTATATIRCRIRQAEGVWHPWISSHRAPEAIGLPLTSRLDTEFRIHFFAASADTLFQLPPGGRTGLGGAWITVARLPGLRLATPMAALNGDGRMEVFSRASDNALWHVYQQTGSSTWSRWESLGRPSGVTLPFGFVTDAVAENDDRRLEVFVVAGDGNVWHIYQTRPNCCWSNWESLGHPGSEPLLNELRVTRRRTGLLELFTLDRQGTLWTIYQE